MEVSIVKSLYHGYLKMEKRKNIRKILCEKRLKFSTETVMDELKRIMSELGDEPLSSEELDVLMNNFDDNGDDRINYDGNVFLFEKI